MHKPTYPNSSEPGSPGPGAPSQPPFLDSAGLRHSQTGLTPTGPSLTIAPPAQLSLQLRNCLLLGLGLLLLLLILLLPLLSS